eukprot:c16628_g1_i1.p1 GENE.c16628_g1_i1~~c16628_g1_i1.p1  ORF type:complete len:280 (-),score=52.02 c16628_g1_i1:24-863(-)
MQPAAGETDQPPAGWLATLPTPPRILNGDQRSQMSKEFCFEPFPSPHKPTTLAVVDPDAPDFPFVPVDSSDSEGSDNCQSLPPSVIFVSRGRFSKFICLQAPNDAVESDDPDTIVEEIRQTQVDVLETQHEFDWLRDEHSKVTARLKEIETQLAKKNELVPKQVEELQLQMQRTKSQGETEIQELRQALVEKEAELVLAREQIAKLQSQILDQPNMATLREELNAERIEKENLERVTSLFDVRDFRLPSQISRRMERVVLVLASFCLFLVARLYYFFLD